MEAAPGFEPGNKGFADPRLTAWLCRHPKERLVFTELLLRACYGLCYGVRFQPLGLGHHQVVGDPRVPLRGDDGAVTQDLLKGG